MKKIITFTVSLLLVSAASFAQNAEYPNRIVSLSPSITEILYELGLGNKVAGVTDYCNFPEDVKNKSRIGGYLNTNYEAIILLKPDLVVVPVNYGGEIKDVFNKAVIEYMTVDTFTVDNILDSIKKIGHRCGVGERGEEIVQHIRRDIERLREKAKGKSSRRVMIVVGRNRGSFENLYIAGKDTFYDGLLNVLGCENVYTKGDINYPTMSLEGVLRLNPDIIIEMLPNYPDEKKSAVAKEWSFLDDVNAVKNNKVYVFNEDYVCIPGPRFTLILEKITEAL
jgi:iron complex transport system substrate-binding protein